MTDQEIFDDELPFSADFMARVMDESDAITARRRRSRSVVAAISVAMIASAVSFAAWQMSPARESDGPRIPREIASNGSIEVGDFKRAQPTLLDFMFPDAAALSQFSQEYEDGNGAAAIENDAVFFPDAEDEAVVDES